MTDIQKVKRMIACKKCNGTFITETTSVRFGTSWLNCLDCGFKSQNGKDFIKEVKE